MDCVALSSSDLCSSSSSGAAGGARVLVRVDQTYRDDEVQKDSQGNEGLTASALVTVVDLRQKTSGPASATLKPSLLAHAILVAPCPPSDPRAMHAGNHRRRAWSFHRASPLSPEITSAWCDVLCVSVPPSSSTEGAVIFMGGGLRGGLTAPAGLCLCRTVCPCAWEV